MQFKQGLIVLEILSGSVMLTGAAIPLSPYLIGQNSFNADVPGQNADRVWDKMKESRFRLIRLGGISNNDKTPPLANFTRWIDSIRSIGAEPLVQVSSIDPVKTAADLVSALNIQRKYAVRYWSIGNEPTCVVKTTAAQMESIAANTKERAIAMKKVDPTIKILFGDECYWKPDFYDPLIGGTNDVTGSLNGTNYIDGVAFHTYPLPGDGRTSLYTRNDVVFGAIPNVYEQFQKCVKRAAMADSIHGRRGANKLSISLTEFNVTYWNSSDNTPSGVGVRSFLGGQFVAEVFGMGMAIGAFTVAPWSIMETNGDGRDADLGLFDGVGGIVPRPPYHHIKMIADNMTGNFISSTTEKTDLLHTYATQDKEEAAVLILNLNETKGFKFSLKLKSGGVGSPLFPTIHVDAGWEGEIMDTIPAQSTLMLKIRKPGETLTRTFYSLALAQKFLPPTIQQLPVSVLKIHDSHPAKFTYLLPIGQKVLRGECVPSSGPSVPTAYEVTLTHFNGTVVAKHLGVGMQWVLPLSDILPGGYLLSLKIGKKTRNQKILLTNKP